MIGRNEDTPVTVAWQGFQKRAHDVAIDFLERFHLGVRLAFMRRLVGRFNMNADEIVISQRRHGSAALGRVIGVEIAGGTGHVDAFPPKQDAHATDQIDGADDGAALAVNLGERPELWRPPLAPKPDLRRRPLAAGPAGSVYSVVVEYG